LSYALEQHVDVRDSDFNIGYNRQVCMYMFVALFGVVA
jgi:hypothetical protein